MTSTLKGNVSAAAISAADDALRDRLGQEDHDGEGHGEAGPHQITAQADSHVHDEHEKTQTHIHGDDEITEYAKPDDLPPDARTFRIFFDSGSARLSDDAWSVVEEAALYALDLGDFEIFIEGFTDTVGNLQVNHKISHERAKITRKALGLSSLPLDAVHIIDYGESRSKLLVPTADGTDEPQNRRVEITVMSPHETLHDTDVAEEGEHHDEHHEASGSEHQESPKIINVNADPADLLDVSIDYPSDPLIEGQGALTIRVHLDRPAEKTTIVSYTTLDGTAKKDSDYEPARGTLTLRRGETEADFSLVLIDDDVAEEDEELKIFLSGDPSLVDLHGGLKTLTIGDDD
ncbi:MAG: Calx-beta domain-containing protein [Geminicoccaceae bacterium]